MDGKVFVLAIIAISTFGWFANNWMRARHGYPLENKRGGTSERNLDNDRQLTLISNENADLKGKILRLEERVAVLERIATDGSRRLSDEIESLR